MLQPYLILAAFLVSMSPPLVALTPVPPNYVFVVFCILYLLTNRRSSWHGRPLLVALVILFSALIAVTLAGDLQYLKYPLYLCLALLIIARAGHQEYDELSVHMDRIIFLGLALSIISFTLYSIWPITPIYTVTNPDGRVNGLYYLTFTNFALPSAIRPSFIFDEPGTFSFVICMGAVLRDLLGKSKATTGLMLLGGLITFSLAHLAVFLLFLFLNRGDRRIKLIIFQLLIVGSLFVYLVPTAIEFLDFFISRFSYDAATGIAGDNRSDQIAYFFEILDPRLFFFGMPECFGTQNVCSDLPDLGSNPFTPISAFGFIFAWPFYLMLFLLLMSSGRQKFRFAALAAVLLLLQRPFLFSFGYSLLILISIAPVLFWRFGTPYPPPIAYDSAGAMA